MSDIQQSEESGQSHVDMTIAKEHEAIFNALKQLADPLSKVMPQTEVAIHDLSKLPNSIVAISGNVTGREEGSPATDMLLTEAANGRVRTQMNYHTKLPDGRELRSTTIAIPDSNGDVFATLCINSEVSVWHQLSDIAEMMMGEAPETQPKENFVQNVNELADIILDKAIASQNVPVELMKKEHKLKALQIARDNGIFLLRDAADTIAEHLHVSRFTIYNYLKELDESEESQDPPAP
ncbi:YheO-like protein [Bifidobacterium margollesii]|uniref:YheO-like protein n=1 Tax=Bifidobacterium margollesii TaxID=2020964 RepID=A0A2N5JAM5_9BIFI|nr:PAS domain-containing protein [Bifidobacterium margollesii]PLS31267.1 YheO-like protein [Bifidobacterium margollesii]